MVAGVSDGSFMGFPGRSAFEEGGQEVIAGAFELASAGHVLEAEAAALELVIADDEDPGRLQLVGPGEMRLHAPVLVFDETLDAVRPDEAGQLERLPLGFIADIGD